MQEVLAPLYAYTLNIGIGIFLVLLVSYILYMIGLILVLRRLKKLSWQAFVPVLNYYAQIKAVNAPKSWFVLSLPPYIGAVYAGSVAIRLGSIFNRGPGFSLIWLTIGAPIGMFILAFSKVPLDKEVLAVKAKLLDIRAIKLKSKLDKETQRSNLA
jgi:hypothetical protein